MNSETNDLISMIESLPIDVKTALVERILESLYPAEEKLDGLWNEEAERRLGSIKSERVRVIPGEEVFKAIRKRYE